MIILLFFPMLLFFPISLKMDFLFFLNNFISWLTDFGSILFISILVLIVSSILLFSFYYMSPQLDFLRFIILMFSFVISMIILILHNSLFTLFIGWDGLGITSYYLVAYYLNWSSMNGAMVTLLTNRLGDCFLFYFLTSIFFTSLDLLSGYFYSLILLICCFTKSAQFPFSSWLPMAMSAPTPISSLVHSSTLVTAGVYLILKYFFLFVGPLILLIMLTSGILTSIYSSSLALMEPDMKKVIALSTLSQMGFLIFSMGLGLPFLSFMHLLTHALFKSCLFIQAGLFIHSTFSLQDGRAYSGKGSLAMSNFSIFGICLLSMCGILFSSGFISKDIILSALGFGTLFFFLWGSLLFIISLTLVYSVRLLALVSSTLPVSFFSESNSFLYKLFSLPLCLGSICGGWIISSNTLQPICLGISSKMMFFGFLLITLIVFYKLSVSSLSSLAKNMGGLTSSMSPTFFFLNKTLLVSNIFPEWVYSFLINCVPNFFPVFLKWGFMGQMFFIFMLFVFFF